MWEDATTKFGFDKRRTYLLGKGLDSVMNYPFKNAVLDFVKGKPAEQAMNEIMTICEHYPAPAMDTALNFLSTHDTERALTVIADEPANGRGREWQSGRCVTGDAYEEGILRLQDGLRHHLHPARRALPVLRRRDRDAGLPRPVQPRLSTAGTATRSGSARCWHSWRSSATPARRSALGVPCGCCGRTAACSTTSALALVETAEIIVNRTEHIIVEPLASGKHTEVNPMGFTIVVEEVGHNPNHSYYDYK